MRVVHYIIPTNAIGGAEKRFIELWCYLNEVQDEFEMSLLISTKLAEAVKNNIALYGKLKPYEQQVKIFDIDTDGNVISFQRKLYSFIRAHTGVNDIVHFILYFPTYVFPIYHNNTIYSLTESSLGNVNVKGKILYLLNMLRSRYLDILDPVIYKQVRAMFFFKRRRIMHTPGSFTDINLFKPANEKRNWFVFLGRFMYVKQVTRLLRALPEICNKLNSAGINDYKFFFLGYGQQTEILLNLLTKAAYRNLPVEIKMSDNPEFILSASKVIFSLQLRTNYPSKSLLEGMAAGNVPVVTDVGTTRRIAEPAFAYYVPEDFSADDIADHLCAIVALDEKTFQAKSSAARLHVQEHFTLKASSDYYQELYKKFHQ